MDLGLQLSYTESFNIVAADFISKNIWDSALNNINRAIQLKDSFRLPIISYFGELRTDFYKALVLLKKGAPKDAVSLLQNEIKELRLLNSIKLLIEDLSLLAEAQEASGNAQEAYQTISEAFALKEKLTAEQNDARSLNFEAEKKMQERENTILLLDTQNKASQKTKYYLFGILGLLGLFITVLTGIFLSR